MKRGGMEGKFIAYYRVSTKKQGQSGLGLEAQKDAVADYLNGGRWKLVAEFIEVESGKKADRPELAKALAMCRLRGATLVVAKLDRLARNVHFLSGLMESKVEFVAADMPQANTLTIHVLAAVAEAEAKAISARTKAALKAAKARGVVLGGNSENVLRAHKKGNRASIKARRALAQERAADLMPIIEAVRADGASSLREIASALTERGIPAPRGGEWSAVQVQRVLKAAEAS
jgi:DNA invertase Pin-like site-specific DNA recombinase